MFFFSFNKHTENLTELRIIVRTTDSIHISEIFQRKIRDSGRHGRRYNCRLKNLQYLDSRYLVCKIITEKFVQFNFVYLGKWSSLYMANDRTWKMCSESTNISMFIELLVFPEMPREHPDTSALTRGSQLTYERSNKIFPEE